MNSSIIKSGPGRKQQMFLEICQEVQGIQLAEGVEFSENIAGPDGSVTYTLKVGIGTSKKSYTITNLKELQEAYNAHPEILIQQDGDSSNGDLHYRLGGNTLSGVREIIDAHRQAVFEKMQQTYVSSTKNNALEDAIFMYLSECDKPYYDPQIKRVGPDGTLGKTFISGRDDEKDGARINLYMREFIRNVTNNVSPQILVKLTQEVSPSILYEFLFEWSQVNNTGKFSPSKTQQLSTIINDFNTDILIDLLSAGREGFPKFGGESILKSCIKEENSEKLKQKIAFYNCEGVVQRALSIDDCDFFPPIGYGMNVQDVAKIFVSAGYRTYWMKRGTVNRTPLKFMSGNQLRILLCRVGADKLGEFIKNLGPYESRPFWSNIKNLDNLAAFINGKNIEDYIKSKRNLAIQQDINFGEHLARSIDNLSREELTT